MADAKQLIIESKHGTFTVLYDAEDAHKVEPYKWSIMEGHDTYYAKRSLPRRADGSRPSPLLMHREITECPKGMVVDHENKNGLDNTRENLRVCTRSENMMNRGKTKFHSGKYKGVYKTGDSKLNPYSAKIQKNKKVYCLGHYKTPEEAAIVYDKKAKELDEEYAYQNFKKAKELDEEYAYQNFSDK